MAQGGDFLQRLLQEALKGSPVGQAGREINTLLSPQGQRPPSPFQTITQGLQGTLGELAETGRGLASNVQREGKRRLKAKRRAAKDEAGIVDVTRPTSGPGLPSQIAEAADAPLPTSQQAETIIKQLEKDVVRDTEGGGKDPGKRGLLRSVARGLFGLGAGDKETENEAIARGLGRFVVAAQSPTVSAALTGPSAQVQSAKARGEAFGRSLTSPLSNERAFEIAQQIDLQQNPKGLIESLRGPSPERLERVNNIALQIIQQGRQGVPFSTFGFGQDLPQAQPTITVEDIQRLQAEQAARRGTGQQQ